MKFEIAEGMRFRCTRCGDCCRHFDVLLGPGEEKKLAALDWSEKEPALADAETVTDSSAIKGKKHRRLRRTEDDSCVYLGPDNQCLIHKHFGGEAKPLICQLYPLTFYPMGSRVGVDASFACKSICEGSGEEIGDALEGLASAALDGKTKDKRRHLLNTKTALPGDLVWEIEFYLITFLKDRSLTFVDRIRACLQFLKLATTGNPTTPNAKVFRDAIAAGIPKQLGKLHREEKMDPTQRAIFYTWLFLYLSQQPGELDGISAIDRVELQDKLTKEAAAFRENEGLPYVNARHLSADFDQIADVDASWFDQPEVPLLERYFTSKIIGKKYLVRPSREVPLIEAARELFMVFPMCVWTAKALAADEGASTLEARHATKAMRLLDRRVGTVDIQDFDKKLRDALEFLLEDTDYVNAAVNELMNLETTGVIREKPEG